MSTPLTVPVNDLTIHRVPMPGTRALTVLIAFCAGSRTERPEENGVAHFLEHLVFKGGEKYRSHRDINETAESLGGVLNAYTSQDLVAFHITVRAESAPQAIDLLTDFVARPRIDEADLERERGVVIQEINRAFDQPSVVAEYLIDRAAFGEHPLGRTVLGPEENLRTFSRDAVVGFRARRWSGSLGGAFLAGNLDHLPDDSILVDHFARFPAIEPPEAFEPARGFAPDTLVEERDTNQSHLRMIYRPAVDVSDLAQRAALTVYATLLGGSMSSRLFEEIREQRGLCYSVSAGDHAFADVPILQLSSGLQSDKCVEAFNRMREIVDELRKNGPERKEVERARTYAAGRLVLAFENSGAVARYAASRAVVFGEAPEPDAAIAALDGVSFEDVAAVAAGISEGLAVACVGPHTTADFN
ncbi:MAG: M16 family metallopeptidase [Solirubrobacteraceae bacterium]